MTARQVVVHEIDGRHRHRVLDGLADYIAVLGAEFADMGPLGVPGDPPLRWHAYRAASALLGVYRSRVDFLRQCACDGAAQRRRGAAVLH